MRTSSIMLFVLLLSTNCFAANYNITASDQLVDGDTFCSGVCQPDDTLTITEDMGDLTLRDMHGSSGHPIILKNPSDKKVTLTNNGLYSANISIFYSTFVSVEGDKYSGEEFGIVCVNDAQTYTPKIANVWIAYNCDDINVSYVEGYSVNNTTNTGLGIRVIGATGETSSTVYNNISLTHNYIHDTVGEGMYVGNNTPATGSTASIANAIIRDNLLVDLGAGGIALKQVTTSTNYIEYNVIRASNRASGESTGLKKDYPHETDFAIRVLDSIDNPTNYIRYNRVEKAWYSGIEFGDSSKNTIADGNIVLGCGLDPSPPHESEIAGITFEYIQGDSSASNNIVIQAVGYGFYDRYNPSGAQATYSNNQIADCGDGEVGGNGYIGGYLTDGGGNNYQANVSSLPSAIVWNSEYPSEEDYSNDYFNINFSTSGLLSGTLTCTSDPRNVTNSISAYLPMQMTIDSSDPGSFAAGTAASTPSGTSVSHTESVACGASYTRYIYIADYWGETEYGPIEVNFSVDSGESPETPLPGPAAGFMQGIVMGGVIKQ